MKKVIILLLLSMNIFAGEIISFTDSYGKKVVINERPKRVISGGPNISEIIYKIGAEDLLVGRTDYCDYPPEIKAIDSVGDMLNPSIESILSKQPDMLIASTHFSEESVNKLRDLGIQVVSLYQDQSFEGVYNNIRVIGKILGHEKETEDQIKYMKNKIEDVKRGVKNKKKPTVYYMIGYGKYGDFTAGKDTFIAELIDMAGGENIVESGGWNYSLEKLLEKDPEIIVCSKYGGMKEGLYSTEGYKELSAVKNNMVFEIDNNMIDRQGVRIADGLEVLAEIFHPEN